MNIFFSNVFVQPRHGSNKILPGPVNLSHVIKVPNYHHWLPRLEVFQVILGN